MITKHHTLEQMRQRGIVAVLRSESEDQAIRVADACVAGGVGVLEVTFSVPAADRVIAAMRAHYTGADVVVGAGTVADVVTARLAILAGAEFIVGPNFCAEVAMLCNAQGVPYIPGCMTVNEMYTALRHGCDVVKLFPADQFSPSIIRSIRAPLPHINIMPTGGINLENAAEWLRAGAFAVGVGGNLTTVRNDEFAVIESIARQYADIARSAH